MAKGNLVVNVYGDNIANPVHNATVTVSKNGKDIITVNTNENGQTAPIILDTVDKSYSEEEQHATRPYETYDVTVTANEIKIVNNNAKVYVTVKNESDKDLHLSMDSITIGENSKSIDVEVAIGGGERQDNILTIKGISKISDLYDKHTGTILIRDMNNTDDVQKIDYINKF